MGGEISILLLILVDCAMFLRLCMRLLYGKGGDVCIYTIFGCHVDFGYFVLMGLFYFGVI